MDIEKVKHEISKQLNLSLEDGILYYANVINSQHGTSGGTLFQLVDGKKDYELCAVQNETLNFMSIEGASDAMFSLTKSFPTNSKILYTFQKGKTMLAEVYTPSMLLEDIQQNISDTPFVRVEEKINFLESKKLELDIESLRTKEDKTIVEVSRSTAQDELEILYYQLNKKIKMLYLLYEAGTSKIASVPAFPEWTIPLYEEPEEHFELDNSNLGKIYSFLESLHEKKIAMALEALKENPELKAKAEGRYLNFIRARLSDPKAELDSIGQLNVINKTNVATMLGKYLDKDFISFSYMDDNETKFIVDYLGSMVRNAFDRKSFYKKAASCEDESALMECYLTHAKKVRNWINKEIKEYPDGWFGKINDKLFNLKLARVLFEKTKFKDANKSMVLDEYMFFLNANHQGGLYFDVCQSNLPEFSSMFWLMYDVPQTNWVDVEPKFPKSILSFERKAKYRIGDSGKWKTLSSLK